MKLITAIRLAQKRVRIIPRGSSSISRTVAILTDGTSDFFGENSYKSHPFVKRFSDNTDKICLHAELEAILEAVRYFSRIRGVSYTTHQYDLSSFRMYVASVLADGTPALAKPCLTCQRALDYYGIHDITWTK